MSYGFLGLHTLQQQKKGLNDGDEKNVGKLGCEGPRNKLESYYACS